MRLEKRKKKDCIKNNLAEKRNTLFFLLMLIFITNLAGLLLWANAVYEQKEIMHISHDSGIYNESIEVTVTSALPGTIYYTVNGETFGRDETESLPQGAMVYEAPINLEQQKDTTLYSFQFYHLLDDGTASEIYRRNYILDAEGSSRFSTTYVVSITGDEKKLFDYDEGIFVRGRQFDEYMKKNPDVDLNTTVVPANYLSDEEVPVNVAVFLQDGTEILSQNCGLKIYGNMTREKNQKSFRLTARYDYDEVNEFSYEFLPKLISTERNAAVDAFQRLSFHNAGNDNGYGFIRTELIGELARRSGFPDVLVSESVTVYVNGRYQGVYWLQNTYDDRYFKEKYGRYEGKMVVCGENLDWMQYKDTETETEKIQFCDEYNIFCQWARQADMSDENNWAYACSVIDMENFARYMAIEYYIGNIDWPGNNVRVYRYKCAEGEEYREDTVYDGKYRYLLFDTDYGMGLKFQGWYGLDAENKRLEALASGEREAVLFASLLKKEEFRRLFIYSVMDLMSNSFSETVVSSVLHEYNAKRDEELRYMMEETDILKNSLWESDDNDMENVEQELMEIIDFAERRPAVVLEELQDMWDCGEPIKLSVSSGEAGKILVGGLKTGKTEYEGVCLANIPMEIAIEPACGIRVTGYYVNSVFMEGEKMELMPGEWPVGSDNSIFIEPVTETEEVESLIISAYHIRGTDDYIILRNNGQTLINLSDYALTDSAEEWSKGKLPELQLEPGEEYVVYGDKYSGEMDKGSTQVPFSWNGKEEILLTHVFKGIVDSKNSGLKAGDSSP